MKKPKKTKRMKVIFEDVKRIAGTDQVPIEHTMGKLFEEVGELAQCVNMTNGMKVTDLTFPQIVLEAKQEIVDVIQNCFWVAQKLGISFEELKECFEEKNDKWEAKIKIKNATVK